MKIILVSFFLMVMICGSTSSFAKHKSKAPVYVDQQMILMGVYLYGINQELTKTVPDLDELQFLAESIEEIAKRTQEAKRGQVFHNNMSELLIQAKKLKKLSQKNKLKAATQQAQNLTKTCAQCHKSGT